MVRLHLLLAAAALVLSPAQAPAQTSHAHPAPPTGPASVRGDDASGPELRGVVVTPSGRPVVDASVVLRSLADPSFALQAATDFDGRFRVPGVRAGRYSLRVDHPGYAPHALAEVALASGGATEIPPIRLARPSGRGHPAVRGGARPADVDRTTYRTGETPFRNSAALLELLESIPELDVNPAGELSHRQAPVQIYLNNRPVPYRGAMLESFLRHLPAERIERVEVISSPSAKFDAGESGTIVNIVYRR